MTTNTAQEGIFTFGVEFEFKDVPIFDVKNRLLDLSLSHKVKYTPRYAHSTGKDWHVKADMSVSETLGDGYIGGEIATPAFYPSQKTYDEICSVLSMLSQMGAKYDNKTGLHIHINMRDLDQMKLIVVWMLLESEIFQIFPERTHTDYAESPYKINKKILDESVFQKLSLITKKEFMYKGHHDILNFYPKRVFREEMNFVEVRVGQMYDNIDKMVAWIKLCWQMVDYASKIGNIYQFLDNIPNLTFFELNKMYPRMPVKLTRMQYKALGIDKTSLLMTV